MTIAVGDVRITFIWFERSLALFADPAPDAPHSFRGRPGSYGTMFRGALDGSPAAQGLSPPWGQEGKHRFWRFYLGHASDPSGLTGIKPWNDLVPFRIQLPLALAAAWFPGNITADGFLYPHGHALVVTARFNPRPALPLAGAVDLARGLRADKSIGTTWDKKPQRQLKLDVIADEALTWLHNTGLGKNAPRGALETEPYSVVTFVRTEGADVTQPIAANGDVHRALEATTAWRTSWKVDKLPQLDDCAADIESLAPAGHVLYVDKRGQSAWFPEKSNLAAGERHTLGCYHRNQVFAALQVESLAGLIRCVEDKLQGGQKLTQVEDDCARRAAGTLGRLFGGHESVYKSGSIKAHIARSNLVSSIDKVRSRYDMPPLI